MVSSEVDIIISKYVEGGGKKGENGRVGLMVVCRNPHIMEVMREGKGGGRGGEGEGDVALEVGEGRKEGGGSKRGEGRRCSTRGGRGERGRRWVLVRKGGGSGGGMRKSGRRQNKREWGETQRKACGAYIQR